MRKTIWPGFVLVMIFALCSCTSVGDGDDWSPPAAQTDDDAGDDDTGDDDTGGAGDWTDIEITAVNAPDEYTILVTLTGDPGDQAAAQADIYGIASDYGDLAVEGASIEPAGNTVSLTTGRQKLGVVYSLTISPGEEAAGDLSADFPSADTAELWAWDFEYATDYSITAYRAGVGEHCVVYIESGQWAPDVTETITIFDEQVFPIETEVFTPAPDVDGNGRILIFGLYGGMWYGGYFSSVNSISDEDAMDWWGYHSNEMDMVYINTDM